MFDIVDARGQRPLVIGDDSSRHGVRRQPVITEYRADHRHVDAGEDVHGSADRRGDSEDEQEHRHDDDGVWASERELDDPEHELPSAKVPRERRFWGNIRRN